MSDILIAILAIIFVLGVAINIHEFGHFMIAKFFGMRVEAYSFFGLGPRIWGIKLGHTDYRISAIPLGAYVKLYGDESNVGLEGADETTEPVPVAELARRPDERTRRHGDEHRPVPMGLGQQRRGDPRASRRD